MRQDFISPGVQRQLGKHSETLLGKKHEDLVRHLDKDVQSAIEKMLRIIDFRATN